jgi:hypothetical protein
MLTLVDGAKHIAYPVAHSQGLLHLSMRSRPTAFLLLSSQRRLEPPGMSNSSTRHQEGLLRGGGQEYGSLKLIVRGQVSWRYRQPEKTRGYYSA